MRVLCINGLAIRLFFIRRYFLLQNIRLKLIFSSVCIVMTSQPILNVHIL